MRNKQDCDARHARVIEYARKNPAVGMPEIGEVFGLDRQAIAYILKTKAPGLYRERGKRGNGTWNS